MDYNKAKTLTGSDEGALARPEAVPALASVLTAGSPRYRMLVSDLDDTLLDDDKRPCAEDLAAIRRLTDAGYIFTFATGRGPWSTSKLHREIGANAPAIIFNGARIVDFANGSRVIFSRVMRREPAIRAIKFAEVIGATVMAFAGENCIAAERDEWVEFYERQTSSACLTVGDLVSHVGGLPEGMEVTKLVFFSKPERRDEIVETLARRFPEFACVGTTPNYSEVLPTGISKGYALERLAKFLGVDMEAIVAVGDAPNDIEMIRCAGFGAAVEDADASVKAEADIIVKAAGRGGIAELISIAFGL